MVEIYLGLVKEAKLEMYEGKGAKITRNVIINIPENPVIVKKEQKQPLDFWLEKIVELGNNKGKIDMASPEYPLVTPCAGAISVFYGNNDTVRYVSFSQKDAGAPRDAGFRVPRNGFPNSEKDWVTNEHLYREAFQEGIFITRNKNELVLSKDGKYDKIIQEVASMLESKTNLRINGTKRIPIIFRGGYDTLHVFKYSDEHTLQKKLMDKGTISWTPETGFNFIKIMEVQYPIEELYLVDGETLPDGTPLRRDVCVLDLEHLQRKRFGDAIEERVHRRTGDGGVKILERFDLFLTDKVPRSVLCQLEFNGESIYPVDWMIESVNFLSRPEVQKAYQEYISNPKNDPNRFKFSQLEKELIVR